MRRETRNFRYELESSPFDYYEIDEKTLLASHDRSQAIMSVEASSSKFVVPHA